MSDRIRSKRTMVLRDFNINDVNEKVDSLEIRMEGDEVVTYYDGREIKRTKVSNRYEIFDFRPYVKKVVEAISQRFKIDRYSLTLVGGRQELRLQSEAIEVKGVKFFKTFFILNSSDRTRALNIAYGLENEKFTFISDKNSINKRHYNGITDLVADVSDFDDTIFNEQLEVLGDLMGTHIKMSKLQEIITDMEDSGNKRKATLEYNFRNFCRKMSKLTTEFSTHEIELLYDHTTDFSVPKNDFHVEGFLALRLYLGIFKGRDSYEIQKESIRILKLTTEENRNRLIDMILNE